MTAKQPRCSVAPRCKCHVFAQEWQLWPSRTPKGENGSKSITKLPTASLKNCRVNWTGGILISLTTEDKTNDAFEEIVYSA